MRKPGIMHILYSFGIGGIENGVANIINATEGRCFHHMICCISTSGDSRKKLTASVPVIELHKKPGNDPRILPRLIKLMRSNRPDIVHTRNWGTIEGIVAARITGIKSVIHGEHGWSKEDPQGKNKKRKIIKKILSCGIDRFIALSEDIRQYLLNDVGIRTEKIALITNGVDTNRYYPKHHCGLKKEYGLENRIVIGSVGRLDPIKRYDLLIKAFSMLDHDRYNTALVIIGDGPDRERLHAMIKKQACRDRILMLGQRDNLSQLYHLMDIFALVSDNEGISNTILEAMASGLPVAATRVGGNTELVRNQESGMLMLPGNVFDIVQNLNFYLLHPEKRCLHGKKAREFAICKYSLQQMVNNYIDLYLEVFKKNII